MLDYFCLCYFPSHFSGSSEKFMNIYCDQLELAQNILADRQRQTEDA
jgi:hypothetical protein